MVNTLVVIHKSDLTLPSGLSRSERTTDWLQKTSQEQYWPTVGLVPDGRHDFWLTSRTTDRDKPDGEQFLMKSSCSHPIVDPDRGKPDGNLGRKFVGCDEANGLDFESRIVAKPQRAKDNVQTCV